MVKLKISLKGRVHAILAKHNLGLSFSNLFGKKGRLFLSNIDIVPTSKEAIDSYLRVIDLLDSELKTFSQDIKNKVKDDEKAKILMSISGVGYHFALLILAEIGDINRFPSAKKLVSFAGLCPSTYSSGGKTYHGKIIKQGSRWLRWAMIEVATHAAIYEPCIKRFYEEKKKEAFEYAKEWSAEAMAKKMMKNYEDAIARYKEKKGKKG